MGKRIVRSQVPCLLTKSKARPPRGKAEGVAICVRLAAREHVSMCGL